MYQECPFLIRYRSFLVQRVVRDFRVTALYLRQISRYHMRLTITLLAATLATTVFSVTSFTPAPDKGRTDTLHNHLFTVGVGAGLIGGLYDGYYPLGSLKQHGNLAWALRISWMGKWSYSRERSIKPSIPVKLLWRMTGN